MLSNFPLASLQESLEWFNLDAYIDEAISAPTIGVRKPAPEAYLALCKKLCVEPEECVFFDDEQVCVAGASAIGMTAYWVNRQQDTHELDKQVIANLRALELIIH
ncbi:HAD family hydrolase [Legionella erythra]|uniref:HAD-superfamily hydrolase n=1 Tax=Legionella erythra TaxID=448 RepID=A0A0W0TQ66_LEGER|nr:HAD family hydrolase [Legionella erythra]KTC97757.1 HAD-superfamily hydrolase [Legionella erythra]